jgi:L-aspartate oxidase
MSQHAGVLRDRAGLNRLLDTLAQAPPAGVLDLATVEATSLHTVSVLVALGALARAESRGCHRWRDVPAACDRHATHTDLLTQDGRAGVLGPVGASA